ncbi:MAG: hypothetical protein KA224_06340, partial [Steroidobacteraceae bacterium]|nr:hypothetical protein [Steroidobacteraceae bacterium]
PSIRDVAQAFDIDNYDQAYDVRIRARMIAQRLCARGAGSVLLYSNRRVAMRCCAARPWRRTTRVERAGGRQHRATVAALARR